MCVCGVPWCGGFTAGVLPGAAAAQPDPGHPHPVLRPGVQGHGLPGGAEHGAQNIAFLRRFDRKNSM